MTLPPFSMDNLQQVRSLLRSLETIGEQRMSYTYNEWLSFHDQVAKRARVALVLLDDAIESANRDGQ